MRLSALALLTITSVGVWNMAVQGQAEAAQIPDVSEQECKVAWEASSAALTCGIPRLHKLATVTNTDRGTCKVHVECRTMDPAGNISLTNNWEGIVDDMLNLHNCDGRLKVGDC